MATITAGMVKDLREKTGAGMMDCKAALKETDGDMEAAVDWLRAKGIAKGDKKSGRIAAEGLVAVAAKDNAAVVIEVNSETDFVARNETFQDIVKTIADVALEVEGDFDALREKQFPGKDVSIEEHLKQMVGTIGENMSLRRSKGLTVSEGVVATYIHSAVAEGLGKIGVLVALESSGDKDKLNEIGKQVAMHVAATNPLALTSEDLDPEIVERERTVLTQQARESGKPDNVIEKMIEGRIQKFYKEVALMSQVFVIDGENTVEKAVKAAEQGVGAPIKVTAFARFALGEGIEKKEENFAEEVAATLKED
ncbi:MAG: translation elongation factor Ts [Pseudomonadota bacterium]